MAVKRYSESRFRAGLCFIFHELCFQRDGRLCMFVKLIGISFPSLIRGKILPLPKKLVHELCLFAKKRLRRWWASEKFALCSLLTVGMPREQGFFFFFLNLFITVLSCSGPTRSFLESSNSIHFYVPKNFRSGPGDCVMMNQKSLFQKHLMKHHGIFAFPFSFEWKRDCKCGFMIKRTINNGIAKRFAKLSVK